MRNVDHLCCLKEENENILPLSTAYERTKDSQIYRSIGNKNLIMILCFVGFRLIDHGFFEFSLASVWKRVLVQNHSHKNVFHLHDHVNQTYFRMEIFVRGLVLKQRQKATGKRSITANHLSVLTTIRFLNNSFYQIRKKNMMERAVP